MVRLCQQRRLLAGLALLCLLLPLGAGRAAGHLLSRGVGFSGVTLAVTAPEGDNTPQLLEQFMGEMEDIAQYCTFTALGGDEAMDALRKGEVTAVLVLPGDFIRGVMWGDNPDLRLIVAGDRPLDRVIVDPSAASWRCPFRSTTPCRWPPISPCPPRRGSSPFTAGTGCASSAACGAWGAARLWDSLAG